MMERMLDFQHDCNFESRQRKTRDLQYAVLLAQLAPRISQQLFKTEI
jgi:hypothetical protein